MRPASRFWIFSAAIMAMPTPVLAQRSFSHVRLAPPPSHVMFTRPAPQAGRLPIAPRIRLVGNTSVSSTSVTTQSSSTANSGFVFFNGAPINLDQLLDPSPSFGFDFEHLNAVNPDLAIKALIDPITQDRLALAERLLRETPVSPISFPFFDTPSVVMLEQQPPVIVLQQPQAAAPAPETAPIEEAQTGASPPPAEAPAPPRDVGTFTLVLHDGTHLSAVAFTRHKDRIVYITSDGVRRSFPLSDLDRDATEQLNEDQGISLQLPQ